MGHGSNRGPESSEQGLGVRCSIIILAGHVEYYEEIAGPYVSAIEQ